MESHKWLEAPTLKAAWEMATGQHANIDYAGFADVGDKDRDLRWIYSKYRYKGYVPRQFVVHCQGTYPLYLYLLYIQRKSRSLSPTSGKP